MPLRDDAASAGPGTVLALDTTTPRGSAALWRRGRDAVVVASDPARGFGEQLPGLLLALLDTQQLVLADVELFAVTAGPGSLTGLRIGIATVQGLALATGRHVVAVSALDALASAACERGIAGREIVGACMNALRGEVYAALYRGHAGNTAEEPTLLEPPGVGRPEEVADRWRAHAGAGDLVVVGDVTPAFRQGLAETFGPDLTLLPAPLLAGVVARVARHRAARGGAVAPHAIQPVYLRRPDAEVARERTAAARAGVKDT